MELFYFPLSTYAQKVLIAMYEKNVAFERKLVNLMDPTERAQYEALYPIGKIPLLMPTPEHKIPESSIIIEYLEGHHATGTKLIPDGVDAARRVRFMDRMCDLYLNDPVTTLLFATMKPEGARDTDALAKARKLLDITYGRLDDHLVNQEWLCGDAFTMADCAAIPPLFYAQGVYPFHKHANLVAYFERATKRSSYRRVLDEALPVWANVQQQMGLAAAA